MSDIAVTWAKAQSCVDARGDKDRNAKQTLVHLASYADANGEGWAAVWVLALEMDVGERSVQRGLQALKDARLIAPTGRFHVFEGKRFPIYRLPIDEGHANTAIRIKVEREARRNKRLATSRVSPQEGQSDTVCPDTGVTPSALATSPESPLGDTGVTPSPDTGVTQIGKLNTQGLKPLARVGARKAQEAWAGKAPSRVSPRRVEAAWLRSIERSGLTDEGLLGAVRAAVAGDPDFERGKAMNLDRWLDEGRYEAWLSVEAETAPGANPVPVAGWAGPELVARVVAGEMGGASAVASYLAPAGWDSDRQVILAATRMAAERLIEGAGRALMSVGIGVETKGAARG